MKLMTIPGHSSTATHIALEWSGLSFEVEIVDSQLLQTPALRARNPQGLPPWLIDGAFGLGQTIAIMLYIDAMAPNAGLFGDGEKVRQV